MAGIFKSLDRSDIRVTPFRTYKLWSDDLSDDSIFTLYKANYNPYSYYTNQDVTNTTFDQGNLFLTTTEPTTSNGKYQRVVHKSLDHLYYRNFYINNKASFGSGNINTQIRFLEDEAYCISMPQSKFGEMILPGSVAISVSWSLAVNSGSLFSTSSIVTASGSWSVVDDNYGNLVISGSDYYSPYGQYVGGVYTNFTSSVTKKIVGEWPFDEGYKYVNAGIFSTTTDFNKGAWLMQSVYNNVKANFLTSSASPSELEFLGAMLYFTASNSSSITIKPSVDSQYVQRYNFENSDFAISMMVMPTQAPSHSSGSVLISKQGPIDVLRVDENGNLYSVNIPNKSPYRLIYTSGSQKIKFEKDTGSSLFSFTSSVALDTNKLYHVVATRSGSLMSLYVNSATSSSLDTATVTVLDKNTSNQSNLYVGNSYKGDQGFNGYIDNLKIYKEHLTQNDVNILHHTLGVGNVQIGNVFYNHGMMTLTSVPSRYMTASRVDVRGTHTIWENEYSCTVNAGDFGMSCNPSLQEYSPEYNQFVYKPFVTGSSFKPYVTTIGLYDDFGRLLVVGKLNTPIQLPSNVDTTFIVRYDK